MNRGSKMSRIKNVIINGSMSCSLNFAKIKEISTGPELLKNCCFQKTCIV